MKTFKHIDDGFNDIKPWLSKKLQERRLSVDRFSVATGGVVDSPSIRRWYADDTRPYPRTMKIVCEVLSKLPVYRKDTITYEEVPWSEGLATYKPRPRAWAAHYANSPGPKSPRESRSRRK